MPLGAPIPPSPAASAALLAAFAERGIGWYPERLVRGLDPARRVAVLARRRRAALRPVPRRARPPGAGGGARVGLCVDGWIPVNPLTLETAYPGVYAVGDVTSVGTPKAGVFSEGQASVVADSSIARHGQTGTARDLRRRGNLLYRVRPRRVARVEVTFRTGERPIGQFDEPSEPAAWPTSPSSGTSRIRRWFGRDWTSY